MRIPEIEHWVLAVADRVQRKQPVEDSRVEIKADWPNADKCARVLAGHANAARGESVLWIFGLDEDRGAVGASDEELSNWHKKVIAQFDQAPPTLVNNVVVDFNGCSLVGLLFETENGPYVVKNPSFGKAQGGSIEREVPWREGNSTRSARHSDLIRILVPALRFPTMEVLSGFLSLAPQKRFLSDSSEETYHWYASILVYVVPKSPDRIVIPFHKCRGTFRINEDHACSYIAFQHVELGPYEPFSAHSSEKSRSLTIEKSATEVIITGPGVLKIEGSVSVVEYDKAQLDFAGGEVEFHGIPIDAAVGFRLKHELTRVQPDPGYLAKWRLIQAV